MNKFCKDCRFHEPAKAGLGWQFDRCLSPSRKLVVNPVTGQEIGEFTFCEENRGALDRLCGPDAKWFEAREQVAA